MEKIFNITPASSGAITTIWIFSAVIILLLVFIIVLFGIIGYQSKYARFTVTDDGLQIGPGFYARFIPRDNIVRDGVKVLNLELEPEYALARRTNGTGLPGFNAGWFTLNNHEKALVFVTDKSNVVYIPTTEGYSVLLSTPQAEEMAETLRTWK